MTISPHLCIDFLMVNQAQKEITVNEALLKIDAVLNSGVISRKLSSPPTFVKDGSLYIVGCASTEDWQDKDNQIAYFFNGWRFIEPNEGMQIWIKEDQSFYFYNGNNWVLSPLGSEKIISTKLAGDSILELDKADIFELSIIKNSTISFSAQSSFRSRTTYIILAESDVTLTWPNNIHWLNDSKFFASLPKGSVTKVELIASPSTAFFYGSIIR